MSESKFIHEIRRYKNWLDAYWVGMYGGKPPDEGDPRFSRYIDMFVFGWAAWHTAQQRERKRKAKAK